MTSAHERRVVARTPRFTVTSWIPEDVSDLAALHSDAILMRFIGKGRPETPAEAHERLCEYMSEDSTRGWTKWRVEDDAGAMVGRAGFGLAGDTREIAFAVRRELWGQGLATELAGALVDWHRSNPTAGLSRSLCAYVEVGNGASARVLEKVGFRIVDERSHSSGALCMFYTLDDNAVPLPSFEPGI